MRAKSLKSSQILRDHIPYFRRPGHIYVSRRLWSVSETLSLWREFVWPYYNYGDESCVGNILRTCGMHYRKWIKLHLRVITLLKIATVILVKQHLHLFYVCSTVVSFIFDVFSCQSNTKLPTIHQYYILSIILPYLHCTYVLTTKVFKSYILYFMVGAYPGFFKGGFQVRL